MKKLLLGTGVLSWPSSERVGDRYGVVGLLPHVGAQFMRLVPMTNGKRGALLVEILETRASHHVGDLFHGFFPSTPKVGEEIELGIGTLFYERDQKPPQPLCYVGLKPSEERATFWLDPPALYRCHDQTVKLWFVEEE